MTRRGLSGEIATAIPRIDERGERYSADVIVSWQGSVSRPRPVGINDPSVEFEADCSMTGAALVGDVPPLTEAEAAHLRDWWVSGGAREAETAAIQQAQECWF